MATGGIVILKGLGDKELIRGMKQFALNTQRTLVRRATKASAKRLKLYVTAGLAGKYVKIRTGRYIAAWLSTPAGPLKRSMKAIGHGVTMPTRAALGIPLKGNRYYPASLEYGWKNPRTGRHIPAKAPIRKSVNEHQLLERNLIQAQLKREIEKEWAKVARKVAKAKAAI